MANTTIFSGDRQEITFSASDFLEEAIDDFLESGKDTSRFASAIIKVATGVELLLKDALEEICPALILEKIDDAGLQVVKVFNIENKMLSPKEIETFDLRTAPFPTLLIRAAKFFDIKTDTAHLNRLHKIRNSLVHHRGRIDVLETNFLLLKNTFPFIEKISRLSKSLNVRISKKTWKKIAQLEALSVDVLSSQLAKKIAHCSSLAGQLSQKKVAFLAKSETETVGKDEVSIEDGLHCPACNNETCTVFQDFEVDYDETGLSSGFYLFSLRCRVCGIELDVDEIRYIVANFENYFDDAVAVEKRYWEQAILPPGTEDA